MGDLADVSTGDLITAQRQNDINDYVHDGTHYLNTLSVKLAGTTTLQDATATTGSMLDLSRNLDSANSDSPVADIANENAGDDQDALKLTQKGTGKVLSFYNASGEVGYIASDGVIHGLKFLYTRTVTVSSDVYLLASETKTINSDSWFLETHTETLLADSNILGTITKTVSSDGWLAETTWFGSPTNDGFSSSYGVLIYSAEKVTNPNATITGLRFWLMKYGSPTGTISYKLIKVSDDSVLASVDVVDASSLTGSLVMHEASFDTPVAITSDVYMTIKADSGDADNHVRIGRDSTNPYPNGTMWYSSDGTSWSDNSPWDLQFQYSILAKVVYLEAHGGSWGADSSVTAKRGVKITMTTNATLRKVTVYSSCTATKCYLQDSAHNQIGSAVDIVSNEATFTSDNSLDDTVTYYILVDNSASTYTDTQFNVTTPISGTYLDWIKGWNGTEDKDTYFFNVESVTLLV